MGRRDQVHLPVVLKAWGDVAKCGELGGAYWIAQGLCWSQRCCYRCNFRIEWEHLWICQVGSLIHLLQMVAINSTTHFELTSADLIRTWWPSFAGLRPRVLVQVQGIEEDTVWHRCSDIARILTDIPALVCSDLRLSRSERILSVEIFWSQAANSFRPEWTVLEASGRDNARIDWSFPDVFQQGMASTAYAHPSVWSLWKYMEISDDGNWWDMYIIHVYNMYITCI